MTISPPRCEGFYKFSIKFIRIQKFSIYLWVRDVLKFRHTFSGRFRFFVPLVPSPAGAPLARSVLSHAHRALEKLSHGRLYNPLLGGYKLGDIRAFFCKKTGWHWRRCDNATKNLRACDNTDNFLKSIGEHGTVWTKILNLPEKLCRWWWYWDFPEKYGKILDENRM